MRRGFRIVIAGLLLAGHAGPARAERDVVLVTARECPVADISPLDIRKAYLGVAVTIDGHAIRAFRLNTDETLRQVFFQSIVAMSEKTYERRLLLLLLKYGTPRPLEFTSNSGLADALVRHDCSIGYMWRSDAVNYQELSIRNLLWQGD